MHRGWRRDGVDLFNTSVFVLQQDSNSRYSALSVQHQMLKVGQRDPQFCRALLCWGDAASLASGSSLQNVSASLVPCSHNSTVKR